MILLRNLDSIVDHNLGDVALCFGNFDGIHLGHQQLLRAQLAKAKELNQELVVITFNPHPKKILQEKNEPFLLVSREKKNELLAAIGCRWLVEIPFTRDFSTLSARQFLETYVLGVKAVKSIFLGWDFAFGSNKSGDADVVREICSEEKNKRIQVISFPAYEFGGNLISSSIIRENIRAGKVDAVSAMLNRNYSLSGLVVKGEGRGKIIGVPTANLAYSEDLVIPMRGVYSSLCNYRGMIYKSVTNIGYNPTFNSTRLTTVETHLIDFDETIYGENIEVQFIKRIRDEMKFSSVNDLVAQIKLDIITAKAGA